MWWYKLHPPPLINVATIPCESENVILQWDITKENCIKYIAYVSSKIEMDLQIIKFGLSCNSACTEQRFVTSMTCKSAWRKLGLTLNITLSRLPVTSGATAWDHVRVLVADTLNTCCKIIVDLYYVVHQNIIWNCQCNLVHVMAIL